MKTKKLFLSILIIFCVGTWVTLQKVSAQGGSVNFQVFYDNLSPYGTWVNNPEYGYVWIPNVASGFCPYSTNGYWVFTDEGWTWVSNYPWGWAPFHYGRWYTDQSYGPIWVPDNEWGPGWVTWRRSGDYYGWAPIGPGVSNNVAYSNAYNPPSNQWTFVRNKDFGRRDLNNYYVNPSNNVAIIKGSTVINNTRINKQRTASYNGGPAKAEVEKLGGRPVTAVAIKESSKPGQSLSNNQLQIYRPQVQKTSSNGHKPAPSKVSSLKNVKPPAQRTGATPTQKVNQADQHHPLPPVRTVQPEKQQQPQQHTVQPAKQPAPQQQQRTAQPPKQQQPQQQRNVQPAKQQTQPKRTVQPIKQQQSQPPRSVQPARQQQPQQQQRTNQPPKQQQPQQQRNAQPAKQQQQQNAQPPKQQQSEPQHENPPQNKEENPPH